jgi:stage II sporulation protein D
MRLFLIFFLVGLSFCSFATIVRVEVLYNTNAQKLQIQMSKGYYQIEVDDSKILRFSAQDDLWLQVVGNKVSLEKNNIQLGIFKSIKLSTQDSGAYLKVITKANKVHYYQDALLIKGLISRLQVINEVELNHYVAGVIESEIGNVRDLELLRVQAVISRTYALRHLDRHKAEQVQLCDRVHCQVYHGRARFNPLIEEAVASTHYEVIVDQKGNLIEAVFHANCGGQTVNSEDVWTLKRDYLRSVRDTFCVKEQQAIWQKELDKTLWLNYLSEAAGKPVSEACSFTQVIRINELPCCSVRMENLRLNFNLKSTFFDVEEYPDKVVLKGRGFGHGVGMCQEGSIKMAASGKSYQEIIQYYYTNVGIKEWNY